MHTMIFRRLAASAFIAVPSRAPFLFPSPRLSVLYSLAHPPSLPLSPDSIYPFAPPPPLPPPLSRGDAALRVATTVRGR